VLFLANERLIPHPWEDDPNADGWWGDEPPFHHPVFILTHHAREPVTKQGGMARLL
jgi:hypothetical protein